MRFFFLIASTFLVTLAACGQGSSFDESFKASFREKAIATCTEQTQGKAPAGMNIDVNKMCGCVTDKIMEGKSATQLATAMPNSTEGMAIAQTCLKELYPNAMK